MMMVSRTRSSSISSSNSATAMNDPSSMLHDDPIPTSPTWKLYHNPFFITNSHDCSSSHHHHKSPSLQRSHSASSRGFATAFWDLNFLKMEENQTVMELKAELDYERKLRKKAESLNKRLAREAAEERSGKEALERVCENLARKVSAEMDRMRREMEEERRMLRMAEVIREERVQMKLSDARVVWEEKMSEIRSLLHEKGIEEHWGIGLAGKEEEEKAEEGKGSDGEAPPSSLAATGDPHAASELPGKCRKLIIGGDKWWWDEVGSGSRDRGIAGGSGGAIENPHIRRGIKGFVEFRRVVRSSNIVGSKSSSSRHWGTKLECQKAQLRILLKQRSPIRSSGNALIIS